jgi:divalent metal cation (Fe/Co/Zn/Cd) transporter
MKISSPLHWLAAVNSKATKGFKWPPHSQDIVAVCFIIVAIFLRFGLSPALFAIGVSLLIFSYGASNVQE